MSEQPTPAVIIAKLAVLESKVDALHKRQDKVVERVDELSKVANIGKGALWAVLKFGGVLLTLGALGAALPGHTPNFK